MAWTFERPQRPAPTRRRAGRRDAPARPRAARCRARRRARDRRADRRVRRVLPRVGAARAGSRRRPGASSTAGAGGITDGSCWTRIARRAGRPRRRARLLHAGDDLGPGRRTAARIEPIPQRAHVSAVFTHPDRWREGIAAALLAVAEDAHARRRATARCSSGRRATRPRGASTRPRAGATTAASSGSPTWGCRSSRTSSSCERSPLRVYLGAFGDPGPRVPDARARRGARRARPRRRAADLAALAGAGARRPGSSSPPRPSTRSSPRASGR